MVKELFLNIEKTTDTLFFDKLHETQIFFSYFQVDENYYLFSYTNQFIDVEFFHENLAVIQELDTKERKIRSIRGFLLYVLEIMETGEEVQIWNTNLEPFFWKRVKNILRQSKKDLLIQFLFKNSETIESDTDPIQLQELQNQIESLQREINSIHKKLDQIQIPSEEKPSLPFSKLSEKSSFKRPSEVPEHLLRNFIETGFQRNKEGKISLREYYEGDGEHSLYQLAGFSIKLETIRQKDLYKQFKERIKI